MSRVALGPIVGRLPSRPVAIRLTSWRPVNQPRYSPTCRTPRQSWRRSWMVPRVLEVELKAVVEDAAATRRRLEAAGATLKFTGRMEDRRYDTPDGRFARRDVVIRLRVYRPSNGGGPQAHLDWKGASSSESGYKIRDELSTMVGDAGTLATILDRLGFVVTREVDRQIWQYQLGPTMVRFEQYPRMDMLLEVEGSPG